MSAGDGFTVDVEAREENGEFCITTDHVTGTADVLVVSVKELADGHKL